MLDQSMPSASASKSAAVAREDAAPLKQRRHATEILVEQIDDTPKYEEANLKLAAASATESSSDFVTESFNTTTNQESSARATSSIGDSQLSS